MNSSDDKMDVIMENMVGFVGDVLGRSERPDPNHEALGVEEAAGHTVIDQIVKAMVESPRAEKAFKRAGVDIAEPGVDAALREALAASVTMFLDDQGVKVQDRAASIGMLKSFAR
jgi:hypothetical protein